MKIPPPPEREPDEVLEPRRDASERNPDPARLTGGAWISLAMSLAFFLLMVAIGLKYGVARHPGSKPAETGSTVLASPLASASEPAPTPAFISAPTPTPAPAPPADDPDTLLARAHKCATAAQWDCVIEATSGVIAQRGNSQETKTLLAQAMVKGGWVPTNAPPAPPSIKGNTRNMREVSTMPPETKRPAPRPHRHKAKPNRLRYTSVTRPRSADEISDIYRH